MVKAVNTEAIGTGTKRSFAEWRSFLDGIGGRDLSHKAIAEAVFETGDASGWWSQSVAVAYEQHIGRRVPGQVGEGAYQASASRTVAGTAAEVHKRWTAFMATRTTIDRVKITRGPETSVTEKWRHWRCGLGNGSRVAITFFQKAPGKVAIGVGHENLKSEDEIVRWRGVWKTLLDGFAKG
jgi:hypothetical protein